MNFENSDEKCGESQPNFCYWNNWIPSKDSINTTHVSKITEQSLSAQSKRGTSRATPAKITPKIKPSSLGNTNVRNEIRLLREKGRGRERQKNLNIAEAGVGKDTLADSRRDECGKDNLKCDGLVEKFSINKDWGKRVELHKILHICDGEKFWNIISRGIFAEVKLWTNEYGNVCCRASGKISVKGVSEKSLIEINTVENLRKMLDLSSMQWSALCEGIQGKNSCLAFNALTDADVKKMSPLEKMWFFICRRRHFLPSICVLVKLSGAVKLLRELRILPKLVVIDIRDFKGEEIS